MRTGACLFADIVFEARVISRILTFPAVTILLSCHSHELPNVRILYTLLALKWVWTKNMNNVSAKSFLCVFQFFYYLPFAAGIPCHAVWIWRNLPNCTTVKEVAQLRTYFRMEERRIGEEGAEGRRAATLLSSWGRGRRKGRKWTGKSEGRDTREGDIRGGLLPDSDTRSWDSSTFIK